jgi:hypothetical protein
MPNLYNNAGFEPDEGTSGDENLSSLGFHAEGEKDSATDEAAEDEEDLVEEVGEKLKESGEDFDLDGETDTEFSAPTLAGADNPIAAANEDEDEAGEEIDLTEDNDDEEDSEDDEEDYDEEDGAEDCAMVSKSKIILAKQLLENIQKSSASLASLFGGLLDDGDEERISIGEISDGSMEDDEEGGRVIEGVFNGENMIGPDGKEYSVPANYASKSKLVEGDMLKLTITDRGTFVYKQTKPVERKRLIGKLEKDANGNYQVKAEHKKFRVITASITYYKGIQGDKVVILVPVAGDSSWAAVENVIKSK